MISMNDYQPINQTDLQAFEERFSARIEGCNEQLDSMQQLMTQLKKLTKQIIFAFVFIEIVCLIAFFCSF